MRELAAQHGLIVEPGRNVIEVRSDGMHKGHAVETLVREQSAGGFLFAGDDLGDVEAFEAVAALREQGMPTLLVAAASDGAVGPGAARRRRRTGSGRGARPAAPAHRRRRRPHLLRVPSDPPACGLDVRMLRRPA